MSESSVAQPVSTQSPLYGIHTDLAMCLHRISGIRETLEMVEDRVNERSGEVSGEVLMMLNHTLEVQLKDMADAIDRLERVKLGKVSA